MSGVTCLLCNKRFKTLRALRGHQLHCPPSIQVAVDSKEFTNIANEDTDEPTNSSDLKMNQKRQKKAENGEERPARKRKPFIPSPLDRHIHKTRSLDPYPLSYIILHGEKHRDDPRLKEARKLFALVYPTIPKDFQHAAVSASCNTKQDFRSFRTIVLSIQNPEGRQVVSCATVKVHSNPKLLEVLFIATNPTLQRRGFGRLLLHLVQDLVLEDGVLQTLACASSDAVPFWKKMGFSMNSSARVHGWRLVQLGGTKVMSQGMENEESNHRLKIASALLRLPLDKHRRAPCLRGQERAIPDLKKWLIRAREEKKRRKDLEAREELLRKEELHVSRREERMARRMLRAQAKLGGSVRRKVPVARSSTRSVESSHSSTRSRGHSSGRAKAKVIALESVDVSRDPSYINTRRVKKFLAGLETRNFYLPHKYMSASGASSSGIQPHSDECHKCGSDTDRLLCCDSCTFVWHLGCLDTPLSAFPPSEFPWHCPVCTSNRRENGKNEGIRSTRSNTRQKWNMRICHVCRRRKNPEAYPEGEWDIPFDQRLCETCRQALDEGNQNNEDDEEKGEEAGGRRNSKRRRISAGDERKDNERRHDEQESNGDRDKNDDITDDADEEGDAIDDDEDAEEDSCDAHDRSSSSSERSSKRRKAQSLPYWVPSTGAWTVSAINGGRRVTFAPDGTLCRNKHEIVEWISENSPRDLKEYLETLDKHSSLYCSSCKRQFRSPQGYARHMKARHEGNDTIKPASSSGKDHGMRCALCHKVGHGKRGEGRLEKAASGIFVHSLCLRFSPKVSQNAGRVRKISAMRAIKRGQQSNCKECGEAGATMRCSVPECTNRYHIYCAMAGGCTFDKLQFLSTSSRGLYCPRHQASNSAKNAAKATRLSAWSTVFEKPLEEKDIMTVSSSSTPAAEEEEESESGMSTGEEHKNQVFEISDEDGGFEVTGETTLDWSSSPGRGMKKFPQIEERVEARYRQRWYPGILKRLKRVNGMLQFGVKCDVDKNNTMILWCASDDIRRELKISGNGNVHGHAEKLSIADTSSSPQRLFGDRKKKDSAQDSHRELEIIDLTYDQEKRAVCEQNRIRKRRGYEKRMNGTAHGTKVNETQLVQGKIPIINLTDWT